MNIGKRLIKDELIGLQAEIVDAKNPAQIGLKGIIVDETKFTITLQTRAGQKRLLKEHITIHIKYQGKILKVAGYVLKGRPEDRIKKR